MHFKTSKLEPALITCVAVVALATGFSRPSVAITVDTVYVGHAGNPSDAADGNASEPGIQNLGAVAHAYRIGKYEVTLGQYTAFLNAVAATDAYALYNPLLATDANIAGIARDGTPGSYTYSTIGSPNRPVTWVSWGDAARFANWLHNGQPGLNGPAVMQDAASTERGAYTLDGAITNDALAAVTRSSGAKWFLPTENEWYKAAYYQPAAQGGDVDHYWEYPMRTNSVPYSDQPPGSAPDNTRVANYYQSDDIDNGYDDGFALTGTTGEVARPDVNYLADVGSYTFSPGPFGTYDQGGNVIEWNENNDRDNFRVVRGGSWLNGSPLYGPGTNGSLGSSAHGSVTPSIETSTFGFRVALVPEPGAALLLSVAVTAMLATRQRLSN